MKKFGFLSWLVFAFLILISSHARAASASGSTIPSNTQLIDSQGNVWTVSSGVVYENGSTAAYTANVILLLYYNGEIYHENSSNYWYQWESGSWSGISGDPRAASNSTSASGSTIPSNTQLIDSQGNVWTVSSGVVYENGSTAAYTANVILLLYYNGVIYHENSSNYWYQWSSGGWVGISGDPRAASSGPSTSASGSTIPSNTQLIDAQGNVWTVSSGVVYENGSTAAYTANVVLLLYYNGVIYHENSSNYWYQWNSGGWVGISGDPRASSSAPSLPFLLGVYEGAQNPTNISNYESWLGRKMDRILDTIPSDSWDNMVNGGWGWFSSQWKGNESRLVVTIPMLPTMGNYGGPSMDDATASANLASGASGAFDSYWVTMRQDLINSGYGSNMIRLGWEMNGSWYNWRASVNPTAWVAYFQRIVTILRDDPNAHFIINFNPTLGYQSIPADQVYPGDAYVDAIGLDVYDSDWNGYYPISSTAPPDQVLAAQTAVWNNDIMNDPHGLAFWAGFAKAHGKIFTIPEWGDLPGGNGQHGGGDDTFFIQSMYNFATNSANGVTLLMYFDQPGLYGTASAPTQFPNSAALYKQLFGQ